MNHFPQLKSQHEINREERRAHMLTLAGDIIGALSIFIIVIGALWIARGLGM